MQPTLTVLSRTAQRHPAKQPLSQQQSGAVGIAVAHAVHSQQWGVELAGRHCATLTALPVGTACCTMVCPAFSAEIGSA